MRARVTTLPVEEIIFNNEVSLLPFEDDKRLRVQKYIKAENKYLLSDGNKYSRNKFIPLAKFATMVDEVGITHILGRLQYSAQNSYNDGDIIYGKPNTIPNKIRLNDLVVVKDYIHVKGWGMDYIWGMVTDTRTASNPSSVEITLPNGDVLIIQKKELLIIGRAPTCTIFNITPNEESK